MIHQSRPAKLQPNTLLPVSSVANTFSGYFPYLFNWIYSPSQKIDWHTETRYPLTSRSLWSKHQDKKQIIGVRFGKQTSYAMIDIDRKSPYHPFNSTAKFDSVLQALQSIGLIESIVIRSSGSEGIHLYYPLPYQINSFSLACGIRFALQSHNLEVASGIIESFPNTKGYDCEFNAHRLPLQNGSYILRNDFVPLSNDVSVFCDRWASAAEWQDLELLVDSCATARENYKPKYATSGKLNDWRKELEEVIETGWTGKGETNQILFKVCEYARVFMGFSELTTLVNWVTDKVTQMTGFKTFCNHQTDLLRKVRDWAKWHLEHRFPMQNNQAKETIQVKKRESQREETLQRIKDVANSLCDRHDGKLTIRAMAQAIAKQAGCSIKTLYNNLGLWHPEHKDTVTANIIDSQRELQAVTQAQETATNHTASVVTQNHYEVLEHGSSNQESLKFGTGAFQPRPDSFIPIPQNQVAPPAPPQNPSFFDNIKIKLLQSKIANRRSGRIDANVLLEIEALEREIAEIKAKLCN